VPIDVVAVGDAPLNEAGEAAVAAAREAMLNASKFGGGSPVDVYAEGDERHIQIFVRDRGPASTPCRSPTTAAACASRSSGSWPATVAAPRSTAPRVRAPR